MNYRELIREEEREDAEDRRQASHIVKRLQGKRALSVKDVIEIQRRKAAAIWRKGGGK